ncbi:hypothetical protein ACTXT7_009694 [Hymenolepis weldensis]
MGQKGRGILFYLNSRIRRFRFLACKPGWMPGPVCGTIKILVSATGAGSLVAGNVLYAFMYVQSWSFLLSFSGAIVAVHVVLFSIFGSKCFKNN